LVSLAHNTKLANMKPIPYIAGMETRKTNNTTIGFPTSLKLYTNLNSKIAIVRYRILKSISRIEYPRSKLILGTGQSQLDSKVPLTCSVLKLEPKDQSIVFIHIHMVVPINI